MRLETRHVQVFIQNTSMLQTGGETLKSCIKSPQLTLSYVVCHIDLQVINAPKLAQSQSLGLQAKDWGILIRQKASDGDPPPDGIGRKHNITYLGCKIGVHRILSC